MSIRSTIVSAIQEIAVEQNKSLQPLTDETVLSETGLDSLCFAILVTRLEDELGLEPFTALEDFYFPVTLGDFVGFYNDVVKVPGSGTHG